MSAPFDTLAASKRLRDAGVEERAAEAIVDLVQTAARMPEIGDLATKNDLGLLKSDLSQLASATKADFERLAREMATKHELAALETRFSEKLRLQGWAIMGGMALLMTISTALIKLVP